MYVYKYMLDIFHVSWKYKLKKNRQQASKFAASRQRVNSFSRHILLEGMDEEAQPGTSFEMPPPYEQPGYEPPSYSGAVNVTTTVTGINAMVSDDPIPGYKQ